MKGLILISSAYQNYKPLEMNVISMIYCNIKKKKTQSLQVTECTQSAKDIQGS